MATVFHGDCLEVMKTLPEKSIDCFVCDLPYGCLTGGGGKEKAKRKAAGSGDHIAGCPWDIPIDLLAFWTEVKRLAKDDHTPVLMFCSTKFGAELIASNPDWFRYDLVWAKTNGVGFLSANKMPLRAHEMVYVFSKKGAYYKRVDITGEFPATAPSGRGRAGGDVYNLATNFGPHHSRGKATESTMNTYNGGKPLPIVDNGSREGIRCVKSVITVANKKGRGRHPTQKPDDLYEWLIERYCPEGGTILDPTAGSFASCRVALSLGRKAIGIEKDPKFYEQFGAPLSAPAP